MITKEEIDKYFDIRDNGLYWKVIKSRRVKIGDRAGNLNKIGYRQIRINKKSYLEHRLIFLWHHDYLPKEIDHINGNPSDNKIENLREATHRQNLMNSQKTKNCLSKFKGVTYHKRDKKWQSQIYNGIKFIFLGYFNIEKEAALAYNKKAIEIFGEFAKLNEIEE